jgi:hypothetical protein
MKVDNKSIWAYNICIDKGFEMTVAIASNFPIADLERVRSQYKLIAKLVNMKLVIRYRGPRYDMMRLTCLKKDAVRFSVYFY